MNLKRLLIAIAILLFISFNSFSQDQKVKLPNGKTVVPERFPLTTL